MLNTPALILLWLLKLARALPRGSNHGHQLGLDGSNMQAPLSFTSDGTFQISVFEDLHFGENAWDQWGPQQDLNSVIVMDTILDAEAPQLVVLNGDLITGENQYRENGTHYLDQLVRPMLDRRLPWASTYGNHDSAFNLSSAALLAREHAWPNARTAAMVPGPAAGVSNYYLPVYAADCTAAPCPPALLLWFFDSRGGAVFQQRNATGDPVGRPDWVDAGVVAWFRRTNAALQRAAGGRAIPSLAFVHIPPRAARVLQTAVGVDPHRQPGVDDDVPLATQAQGWCPDGTDDGTCAYGGQDVPFMRALVDTPGLVALFSGHDHGDTWCYKWEGRLPNMTVAGNGLNLCFGQHSGYGGYGTWIRGSRQIRVTKELLQQGAVETWVRLEDESEAGRVTLNATYGMDEYPATPNKHTECPTCNYTIITPMPGTNGSRKAAHGLGK